MALFVARLVLLARLKIGLMVSTAQHGPQPDPRCQNCTILELEVVHLQHILMSEGIEYNCECDRIEEDNLCLENVWLMCRLFIVIECSEMNYSVPYIS